MKLKQLEAWFWGEIGDGELIVVPSGKWHQLTATDNVNIMFPSPPEDGAERTREHPFGK